MRGRGACCRLNAEIVDIFSDEDLAGNIRFGVPDDYAVKLLPIILSSFQNTHPRSRSMCAACPRRTCSTA